MKEETHSPNIDVEVLELGTKHEVGFIFRTEDGSRITPQQILDALSEVLLFEFNYVPPTRGTEGLDS